MPDPYPPPNDGPDLSLLGKYPVLILGAIVAAVAAVCDMLVSLGVFQLSDEQQSYISKAIYAVGALVLLILLARHTVSKRKVISNVTNDGVIVAGDAAVEPTGSKLVTASDARGRQVPLATAKRALATADTPDIPYEPAEPQSASCKRFHPNQACRPGQNHPAANMP